MKTRFSTLLHLLLLVVIVCLLPRVIAAKGPVITNKGETSRTLYMHNFLLLLFH